MIPAEELGLEVVEHVEAEDGTIVEVLQYPALSGSADIRTARNLYYAAQAGMHLKMVRIHLKESHVRSEPGAIQFMQGQLETKASTGGGALKGFARKMMSGESFFVNEIHGTGTVYLEPTFGHFFLHRIEPKEGGVIVDKSLFFAGTSGLDIGAVAQKNLSAAVLGGEGIFQTQISGAGVAVLYSPVPQSEILRMELQGDKLAVDGNFALMRSSSVDFSVEKSSKGLMSTAVSGEGVLQTFQGKGYVWIAPTQGVYERLSTPQGIRSLALPPGASHTETSS